MKIEEMICQMKRRVLLAPEIVGLSNTSISINIPPPNRMARILPRPSWSDSQEGISSGSSLDVGILGNSLRVSHTFGSPIFLARPWSCISKLYRVSTSKEGCSYLVNLIDEVLEEEFSNLAYYTRRAGQSVGSAFRMFFYPINNVRRDDY